MGSKSLLTIPAKSGNSHSNGMSTSAHLLAIWCHHCMSNALSFDTSNKYLPASPYDALLCLPSFKMEHTWTSTFGQSRLWESLIANIDIARVRLCHCAHESMSCDNLSAWMLCHRQRTGRQLVNEGRELSPYIMH